MSDVLSEDELLARFVAFLGAEVDLLERDAAVVERDLTTQGNVLGMIAMNETRRC